jgi:hypothetical protein
MSRVLSRKEVDELLGVDPDERMLSQDEMKLFLEEVKKAENESGVSHGELSEEVIKNIIKKLDFENVKFYDRDGNPLG